MNLLLDTHVFIWALADPSRLDRRVLTALASWEHRIFVSAVTPWEIAIKQASGRLRFPLEHFDNIVEHLGGDILPILPVHGITAGALPRHHNDPFDRMLIAQALTDDLILVTSDRDILLYEVPIFGSPAH